MNKSDTPETDAIEPQIGRSRGGWVRADFARELERERNEYRSALEQIRARPDWQDPEVGFMSGHIAAGALNFFQPR